MDQVYEAAIALVSNLADIAQEEEQEEQAPEDETKVDQRPLTPIKVSDDAAELPDGSGKTVFCIGGRGPLDDASAAMLAQVLQVQGAEVVVARHLDLSDRRGTNLVPERTSAIVVCFLNEDSGRHARMVVRRLKRLYPAARVGAVLWTESQDDKLTLDLEEADFVALNLSSAAREALSDTQPPLVAPPRKIRIRRHLNKPSNTVGHSKPI